MGKRNPIKSRELLDRINMISKEHISNWDLILQEQELKSNLRQAKESGTVAQQRSLQKQLTDIQQKLGRPRRRKTTSAKYSPHEKKTKRRTQSSGTHRSSPVDKGSSKARKHPPRN